MARGRQATTDPAAAAAAADGAARRVGLTRRQLADMTLPGVVIGLVGGALAGALAASAGLAFPGPLVAGFALAVPLSLAGAGFELLLATGRVPLGPLGPVALYWLVAFPVARCIDTALLQLYAGAKFAVPYGWGAFVIYQLLVAVGFSIGYWWLHENFAPRWWWHLRERNPVANHFVSYALAHAVEVERKRERQRRRRAPSAQETSRRATSRGATSRRATSPRAESK